MAATLFWEGCAGHNGKGVLGIIKGRNGRGGGVHEFLGYMTGNAIGCEGGSCLIKTKNEVEKFRKGKGKK